ncbi:MAG TPA: hypothetical protein VIV57_00590 [Anaeromyxobacter sp.]
MSALDRDPDLDPTWTSTATFNACVAHGGGAWDHSAMLRALERLAGTAAAG